MASMMKTKERNNNNNNNKERKSKEVIVELIPSEQDRKAILGCLSYVLVALYCDRHNDSSSRNTASADNENENDNYSWSEREGGAEQQQQSRSARFDTKSKSMSSFSVTDNKHRDKTRNFQQYCINIAVELLYLDKSNAVAFSAPLDTCLIHDNANPQQQFLHPYLTSFSSEKAAFQCIALLLCRFLLCSAGTLADDDYNDSAVVVVGYDARIRVVFKTLAVTVLSHFLNAKQNTTEATATTWTLSTRIFEALENEVSAKLIAFAAAQQQNSTTTNAITERTRTSTTRREKVIRGLKVGGASVAAGALFALTGGLAAPALAAGVAAIAGGTVVATVVGMALSSVVAVTTVLGVGGGGLVAAKMMKRTEGLSEFNIVRQQDTITTTLEEQLSRCLCISGWLRDTLDFQRPWGVTPAEDGQQPTLEELLVRFYSVYAPEVAPECTMILEQWRGRENKLWEALTEKYGRNPSTLLPLHGLSRQAAALFSESNNNNNNDHMEKAWVDEVLDGLLLGLQKTHLDDDTSSKIAQKRKQQQSLPCTTSAFTSAPRQSTCAPQPVAAATATAQPNAPSADSPLAAWDYLAEYSGELYTVKWESNLLLQLNNSVKDLAKNIASNATSEVLKYTALTGIVAAVALPVGLLQICNMIDGPWTLAIERSDEAGKELAVSLLESRAAGHRPVSLCGYSFGARVIYACLIELARHQRLWEEQQQQLKEKHTSTKRDDLRNNKTNWKTNNNRDGCNYNKHGGGEIDIYNYQPTHYYREPASIVEDVILIGCPVSLHLRDFAKCRQIVAGRLVNCYVPNDMMLRLMFRYKQTTISGIFRSPCGTVPVDIAGVEDYDVSQFVSWHSDYCFATRSILGMIGHGEPTLHRNTNKLS